MRRILVDSLLVLSVLLSAIVAAAAVRSHSVEDRIYHAAWRLRPSGATQKSYWLMSEKGLAGIGIGTLVVPSEALTDAQRAEYQRVALTPVRSWHSVSVRRSGVPPTGSPLNRAGFSFADSSHSTSDGLTFRYQELVLPYWFILLALWAGPVWRIVTAWRLYAARGDNAAPTDVDPTVAAAV